MCGDEGNLQNGGFLGQAIGERVKLNGTAGDANRKLLMEKLGGNEKIPRGGARAEFHHVEEANAGLFHGAPFVHFLD